jgi:hypothetical protein
MLAAAGRADHLVRSTGAAYQFLKWPAAFFTDKFKDWHIKISPFDNLAILKLDAPGRKRLQQNGGNSQLFQ